MIIIGVKSTDAEAVRASLDALGGIDYKIFDNLTFNVGWTAVSIDAESLDDSWPKTISRDTNTVVVAYEEVDVVGVYKVITYRDGNLQDEFSVVDFIVDETTGYFENAPEEFEDQGEISGVFNDYFKEIGFEPLASEILTHLLDEVES